MSINLRIMNIIRVTGFIICVCLAIANLLWGGWIGAVFASVPPLLMLHTEYRKWRRHQPTKE